MFRALSRLFRPETPAAPQNGLKVKLEADRLEARDCPAVYGFGRYSYVMLNPQPLPPGGHVMLNPQPLPPRMAYSFWVG